MSLTLSKLRPERLFLLLSLLFGGCLTFLVPPFQAPDEFNHYYRARQILDGVFFSEKTPQGLGGRISVSAREILSVFEDIPFRPEARTSPAEILAALRHPSADEPKRFIGFSNTALYSPVNYLPQLAGIALARPFTANPLAHMYSGRICNLLLWTLLVFLSIKTAPIFKWLILCLALLPMSLFLSSTLSADPMTNGLSFFIIASILKLAFLLGPAVRPKDMRGIFAATSILSLAKPFYLLVVCFYFFIPAERFASPRSRYFLFLAAFSPPLALQFLWLWLTGQAYVAHRTDTPVSPQAQLAYLLHHPFSFLEAALRTLYHSAPDIIAMFLGTLGWLDTFLPPPLLWLTGGTLALTALLDHQRNLAVTWRQKAIAILVFFGITLLVYLAQYLHWNPVGATFIEGMQGRYLIAFSPLLFLTLYNRKLPEAEDFRSSFRIFLSVSLPTILSWTLLEVYERYYG